MTCPLWRKWRKIKLRQQQTESAPRFVHLWFTQTRYTCLHIHMSVPTCQHIHMHMSAHKHTCLHTPTHVCTHTCRGRVKKFHFQCNALEVWKCLSGKQFGWNVKIWQLKTNHVHLTLVNMIQRLLLFQLTVMIVSISSNQLSTILCDELMFTNWHLVSGHRRPTVSNISLQQSIITPIVV